jgi:hypothetical protein
MTVSTSNEAAQLSQPAPTAIKKPEFNPPSPSASTASTLPVDNPSCACGSTTIESSKTPLSQINTKTASVRSRPSQEQDKKQESLHQDVDNTAEFNGEVATNNELPSPELVKKIGEFMVLDKDGKSLPFRNIYSGPNVVRRVLVIFIRHFFCGVSLVPRVFLQGAALCTDNGFPELPGVRSNTLRNTITLTI